MFSIIFAKMQIFYMNKRISTIIFLFLLISQPVKADTFGGAFQDFSPNFAYQIFTDTTNFDNALSASDVTVQLALDTLDYWASQPTAETDPLSLHLNTDNDPLTDNLHFSVAKGLTDADGDTKIQLEESADEDIIRFDTGGTERMRIGSDGRIFYTPNSTSEIFTSADISISDSRTGLGNVSRYGIGMYQDYTYSAALSSNSVRGFSLNTTLSGTVGAGSRLDGLDFILGDHHSTGTLANIYGVIGSISTNADAAVGDV